MNNVFTAPLAIIKMGNQAIGKIRNLNFQENIQRGEVQGLGELFLKEVPALSVRCQFNASSYVIDLKRLGTAKNILWPVDAPDSQILAKTILLAQQGVSIYVYRKVPSGAVDANGLLKESTDALMGVAKDCYLNSQSWEISEGAVSGRNISGIYLTPMSGTGDLRNLENAPSFDCK